MDNQFGASLKALMANLVQDETNYKNQRMAAVKSDQLDPFIAGKNSEFSRAADILKAEKDAAILRATEVYNASVKKAQEEKEVSIQAATEKYDKTIERLLEAKNRDVEDKERTIRAAIAAEADEKFKAVREKLTEAIRAAEAVNE